MSKVKNFFIKAVKAYFNAMSEAYKHEYSMYVRV